MKFTQYLKETKNELKEVVFPTTATTITFTVIVIAVSVFIAAFLAGVYFSLREDVERVINR